MINNTDSNTYPWAHIESYECPACDDGNEHFFVNFHIEGGHIDQCTTCGTQFDTEGIPLEDPITKYKEDYDEE